MYLSLYIYVYIYIYIWPKSLDSKATGRRLGQAVMGRGWPPLGPLGPSLCRCKRYYKYYTVL